MKALMRHNHLLSALIILLFLSNCTQKPIHIEEYDFGAYYDEYEVKGSFVLYDPQEEVYTYYNRKQFTEPFLPASTFKICNSLIGLETGVIPDADYVISWDSIVRNPIWDQDHNLRTAFQNSVVWYYQELARQVGEENMQTWLEKTNYGNANSSGELDLFWLTGDLRISPAQQIDFLERLQQRNLPFSQRSMEIVREIMIEKNTVDYVLRAKTGWGGQDSLDIGWYVGYLETQGKIYFFSNCIQAPSQQNEDSQKAGLFNRARREIVQKILTDLKLIN